jgi:GMP synthase (glutamine-hydrolysing)
VRILTLQNNNISPSGLFGAALAEAGAVEDTRFPERGDALPIDAVGYDGLLVLGGTQHAADDRAHPYVAAETALIRRFAAAGRPIMGICLGAQLVARAFGSAVRRHHTPEVGFAAIEALPAAEADPLFAGLTPLPPLMQWHYDTFDLPPGATLLATSPVCANQAFALPGGIWGLQFHAEVDAAILRRWAACLDLAARTRFPDFCNGIEAEIEAHLPAAERFTRAIGRRWAAIAARARPAQDGSGGSALRSVAR